LDRLREVDDGAVALVVIASSPSSVSRPSRPTARALDLAQEFGDAVQRDLGGEGGGDTRPARTLKGAVQSEREAARLVRAAVAAGAREASRRRAGAA